MNIWIISHYAIPPTEAGSTRHYSLARELIANGHDVRIIASNFSYMSRRKIKEGRGIQETEYNDVPFRLLPVPRYTQNSWLRIANMLSFALQVFFRPIFRDLPQPDVIISTSPHLFAPYATYYIAKRYNVPFVFEVRDLWPSTIIEVGNYSEKHPFIQVLSRIESFLYKRSDHIISLKIAEKDYIIAHGGRDEHITWITNGVDLKFIKAEEPKVNERFTLMYMGQMGASNNLDVVLEAARLLEADGLQDQVCFRLVGGGAEQARLEKRIRDEGLQTIIFEPPIGKQEVSKRLSEADAFLMTYKDISTTRTGTSFNKLKDYMAAGRPVIFAVKTEHNPVAEAQAGISVPPDGAHEMADAIRQLMAMSQEERTAIGQRGRAWVEENFDYAKLAKDLEDVLYKLTEGAVAAQ